MTRPVIGLTAYRRSLATPLGEQTDLYTLDPAYTNCVEAAGGQPLIIPHGDDPTGLLDLLDGLVLTGGGDLDPQHYGESAEVTLEDPNAGADVWELALARAAAARTLPVLGICRGMQTLAVASGGTMIQDLEEHHGHPLIPKNPQALMESRHPIELAAGSRIAEVMGTTTFPVNSIHHQAVVDAGTLKATARIGAVIEALEGPDDWPIIGVQWHPEKMHEPEQLALFRDLIAAAQRFHAR